MSELTLKLLFGASPCLGGRGYRRKGGFPDTTLDLMVVDGAEIWRQYKGGSRQRAAGFTPEDCERFVAEGDWERVLVRRYRLKGGFPGEAAFLEVLDSMVWVQLQDGSRHEALLYTPEDCEAYVAKDVWERV